MQAKPYLRSITLNRDNILSFDQYPFNIPSIRTLKVLEFHPDVTFLVGENGTGKSTLVEAIALAMGFGPEGGTKNVRVSTAATVSELYKHLKTVKSFATPKDHYFLRAESFYNVATYMDEVGYLEGYGGKSLHARSHGESFMATLSQKLRGNGLYILDEPEAALSPTRAMAALAAIHQLVLDGSQFIIATHSPILLAYPRARILLLDDSGMKQISYEDTEHYAVTKGFLDNYKKMLTELMKDD
jgi:predicted ATPase